MKKCLIGILLSLVSSASIAQDCPERLVPMGAFREVIDGLTHSLSIADTDTRYIEAEYVDNRNYVGYYWFYNGEVSFTNMSDVDRTMRFRISVSEVLLPSVPTELTNTCYEESTGELVVLVETVVLAGQTSIVGFSGSVVFEDPTDGADLNGDYAVDGDDLGIFYSYWLQNTTDNPEAAIADFNNDGIVNGEDLGLLLMRWTDGQD